MQCSSLIARFLSLHTHPQLLGRGQRPKQFQNQIKGINACSNIVANIFPQTPNLGLESKGQYSTFSEYNHIAYQIIGNDACSKKVAFFYLQTPLPPLPWDVVEKSKFIFNIAWSYYKSILSNAFAGFKSVKMQMFKKKRYFVIQR